MTKVEIQHDFLAGGGQLGALIRAKDWAATPLGPVETWPQSLRTALDMMLALPQPVYIAWGPDLISFYNDGYIPILGAKHPDGLARPYAELFAEIWDEYRPLIEATLAGTAHRFVDKSVALAGRPGRPLSWFSFSWTPLRDDAGMIAGFFCLANETTESVLAERGLKANQERQAFLLKLSDALRPLAHPLGIQDAAARVLGEQLDADRTYYGIIEGDFESAVVERDFVQGDAPSMVGRHLFADFPMALPAYREGRPLVIEDVQAPGLLSPKEQGAFAAVAARTVVSTALIKEGRGVATMTVLKIRPHAWTENEIALVIETGERTWAAVERAQAEAALRESEEKYRSLFETMGQGYGEQEIVRDEAGRAIDLRLIEANARLEVLTGLPRAATVGKLFSESLPGLEPAWIERMDRVVRSGEPETFENEVTALGRWYNVHAYPRGGDRFVVLYDDITERKRTEMALRESEERQAFMLKLSDALRPLADPVEIRRAALDQVATHFSVQMAVYTEFDEDGDRGVIDESQGSADVPFPINLRLADFGPHVSGELAAGRTVVYEDVETDPLLSASLDAFRALNIASGVGIPLIKDARLVAAFAVNHTEQRRWTRSEVMLLEDVAERIWGAVERARAEAALRKSEADLGYELANIKELQEVSGLLVAGEDNAALYGRILDAAMAIMRADFASLQVYDSEHEELKLLGHKNYHPDSARFWDRVSISSGTTCGAAMRDGDRLFAADAIAFDPAGADAYAKSGIVSVQSTPLTARDGRLIGMISTHWRAPPVPDDTMYRAFDILVRQTADAFERTRTVAALRESEDRLRRFGEASQDVVWIRDVDTLQWVYLTPAFETVYGLRREEVLTGNNYKNWQDLILPEDRDDAVASIARVAAGEWVTFEYRVRRPSDGAVRWLRDTDFPITDNNGKTILIGGIGHDFTDVREAELRLQTLVEGIPQLVWRAVGGGDWTWASPQWTNYTGQAEGEYIDWGWIAALHPDDQAAAREAWSLALENGGLEVEYRLKRQADQVFRWFQTRAVPVRDRAGLIIEWLGTSTDIHDLRELQERQEVLVAELQHRTRNLIGVVRSTADKTARTSVDIADFRARFRDRLDALARVQGLLSRLNDHDRVTFDELINTELTAMNGNAKRATVHGPLGIRLRSSTVQTLAMALHELATNAVKYGALGQANGRLAITWTVEPAGDDREPWLHIDWLETGVVMPKLGAAAQGSGQGRELIERALPYQLSARTTYVLGPDGVRCTISVPISASAGEEQTDHV